jgi:hypothetical protein
MIDLLLLNFIPLKILQLTNCMYICSSIKCWHRLHHLLFKHGKSIYHRSSGKIQSNQSMNKKEVIKIVAESKRGKSTCNELK